VPAAGERKSGAPEGVVSARPHALARAVGDTPSHTWKISHGEINRRIRHLARRQYGHVTRAQLLAAGVGRGAIEARLAAGFFVAVFPGVYAIAPRRDDPLARAAAAVLAGGPDAVLSHDSAASLWGMQRHWDGPLEVTLTNGDRRPRGIRTHRSRALTRRDVRRQLGIPATSPARTLLDIAPRTPEPRFTRMVNDARRSGHVHLATLEDLVGRCPNHPGAPILKAFVQRPHGPTRSEFEDRFLAFARDYSLPTPVVNTHVHGYEADALFEEAKLIVELDGWEFHRDRTAFGDDRDRDAELLTYGYATIRVTWERLRDAPEREAARLLRILRGRGRGRGRAGRPTR
jgi:very-short-patch-repair endonuclease